MSNPPLSSTPDRRSEQRAAATPSPQVPESRFSSRLSQAGSWLEGFSPSRRDAKRYITRLINWDSAKLPALNEARPTGSIHSVHDQHGYVVGEEAPVLGQAERADSYATLVELKAAGHHPSTSDVSTGARCSLNNSPLSGAGTGDEEKRTQPTSTTNNDNNNDRDPHDDRNAATDTSAAEEDAERRDAVPDGGLRAWLTVLGSFCTFTAGFGLLNSVGILQAYMESHQLSSFPPRDVAWIPAVNIFLCLFLGVQVGPLFDHFGPRWLMGIGTVGYVGGLVAMSLLDDGSCEECAGGSGGKRYTSLLLTYGVVVGSSAALLTTTALSVTGQWFDKWRGLANGTVFVGSSLGGIVFPLVMRECFGSLGWSVTIQIVAGVAGFLLVLGNLLIRGRSLRRKGEGRRMKWTIDLRCFRDWRFVWTVAGISLFQFVVVGAMGMLPTWVKLQGFDDDHAFNVVALVNTGSGVGRIAAGALSDRMGRYNTAMAALTWIMLVTFLVWVFIDRSGWMVYLFGPLFGLGTGSLISMAPVCIGQLCKSDEFGRYYGTSQSIVSIFGLICIPVSATILQLLSPLVLVMVFGSCIGASLILFIVARWSCLNYNWQWKVKV